MQESCFETSDGVKIAYSNLGDEKAEAILFNYGLACNKNHWKYQVPFFIRHGYQVILHDYRFHFGSTGTGDIEVCTFENMANDIRELLEYLGIETAFIVGHSMGVNISLEFAQRFPEKVSSLVLISGTLLPPQEVMFNSKIMDVAIPYIKLFREHFPYTFEQFWKTQHENPLARKFVHKSGFNSERVSEEFVTIYMKHISELPHELFFRLMEEMRNHNIIQYMGQIKNPALVIEGESDRVIPPYLQRMIHQYLKGSELYVVKDGSHVPQVDFPEQINERMLHFFQRGHEFRLPR